jgi:hypothetical protein
MYKAKAFNFDSGVYGTVVLVTIIGPTCWFLTATAVLSFLFAVMNALTAWCFSFWLGSIAKPLVVQIGLFRAHNLLIGRGSGRDKV